MEKSLVSNEYPLFLEFLRKIRIDAGITQEQVAERLKATQSFVSKTERGERRLDIIELRLWCNALGYSLTQFTQNLEEYFENIRN